MYMKVNEIFRYEMRVLDVKLRAYEQLGLNRSTVIKLVTCSPQLLVGEVNDAFIRVLDELKELGFDLNWIGGSLSSENKYNWNRILNALRFFREVGYNHAQMGAMLKNESALLFDGSGRQVYVVFGALFKLGLNMNEAYALVSENHQILSPKCVKNFRKALHFLFEIGMEPEDIAQILSNHMKLFSSHSLKGPKTVLRNFNYDKHSLRQTLKKDPSTFFNIAFKSNVCSTKHAAARNPNNFVDKTEFLLRIGYVENSEEMVKALKLFRGRGDQLQERFDCLVKAGLDFNAVSSMVKLAPAVLNQTKCVLEKKIEFLKNLGYPVDAIVSFPSYLCYDMNRISLRFSMYGWVRGKGVAKPMLSLSTLLACSEARFAKYFVNIHPEGPVLWESLQKSLPSS
ncbi:Mitochondrial transcription termination factor, mTERF [Handroanthus impetiginosus]|uniref:Mitochondrial transcription termination factor, mTERF n=1 Tax=Handroanthus impetiginosus TaxID=429701 RepID=A0A2G9I4Y1_9LAMI|nr:Mitochondrial transcription termination factor, mTERF [Handroanthus impetiginosus]